MGLARSKPLLPLSNLILANIVSSILISLLPDIRAALVPGGTAILSGILVDEMQDFATVVESNDWRIVDQYQEGAWYALAIR